MANDEDIEKLEGKQHFTKLVTTKKNPKKKRKWLITYRLVDGPPVDMAKSDAAKKRKQKTQTKTKKTKIKKTKTSK